MECPKVLLHFSLLCALLASSASAVPLRQREDEARDSVGSVGLILPLRSTDLIPECAISGNPELYGLGIRIGIYLQWTTSLLANHFFDEAVSDNLDTNTMFLGAVFIALVVATLQSAIEPVEIVILLRVCFGFLFSVLSIWGLRVRSQKKKFGFSVAGSFLRLAIAAAICAYSIWFWFKGLDTELSDSCTVYYPLFARLDVREGIRIFLKAWSILLMIPFGLLFLNEGLTIVIDHLLSTFQEGYSLERLYRHIVNLWLMIAWGAAHFLAILLCGKSPFREKPCHISESILHAGRAVLNSFRISLLRAIYISNIICYAWSILSIELLLKWNQVEDVQIQSTGQLIPLVIAVTGFLRLLHFIYLYRANVVATDLCMEFLDNNPNDVEADGSNPQDHTSVSHNGSSLSSVVRVDIRREDHPRRSSSHRRRYRPRGTHVPSVELDRRQAVGTADISPRLSFRSDQRINPSTPQTSLSSSRHSLHIEPDHPGEVHLEPSISSSEHSNRGDSRVEGYELSDLPLEGAPTIPSVTRQAEATETRPGSQQPSIGGRHAQIWEVLPLVLSKKFGISNGKRNKIFEALVRRLIQAAVGVGRGIDALSPQTTRVGTNETIASEMDGQAQDIEPQGKRDKIRPQVRETIENVWMKAPRGSSPYDLLIKSIDLYAEIESSELRGAELMPLLSFFFSEIRDIREKRLAGTLSVTQQYEEVKKFFDTPLPKLEILHAQLRKKEKEKDRRTFSNVLGIEEQELRFPPMGRILARRNSC